MADKISHTKGPWKYSHHKVLEMPVIEAHRNDSTPFNSYYVAYVETTEPPEQAEANARLIAAAPELLEALEMFLVQYHIIGDDHRELRPEIKAALAAIATAKGERP